MSAVAVVLGFAALAVFAFWWQDWRYSRPTPRPAALVQPPPGTHLALAALERPLAARPGRPALLHFYNPHCPCSRFNVDEVRELQRAYGDRVTFVAVVQGADARAARAALDHAGLRMDVVADPGGTIAASCGVYASPQAVVLDAAGRLYYRGNYNTSRYCTDAATEFARLALDSLFAGAPPPRFAASGVSYGCELPSWKRRRG